MTGRLHAARVISRRQCLETLLSPGLYITFALGLLLGFFLISGFASSLDSSGFNPTLNPIYDLVGRSATSAFGMAFFQGMFAEGPFLFALVLSFLPVFLFLSIGSVFRFGQEKAAGAVELLSYGPSDGTSYFIASFVKDGVFSLAALAIIALYFRFCAGLCNMTLGPLFLVALPILFLLSLFVSAYGIACSILSSNASSALAAFIGILVLFAAALAGSLSMSGGTASSIAAVASAALKWISPFSYAALCLRSAQSGSVAGVLGGMALMAALTAAFLVLGHFAMERKGVRA